jgi:LacI family transcriptional regulator
LATQHRVEGAKRALSAAGEALVLGAPLYGEWSEKWGREAALRLIRSGAPLSGVFCASDQIARGVADGFRENGVTVPQQVGIVGVDNWDVMAGASRPPLTTIDLNLAELGHVAATRLLSAIDGHLIGHGVEFVAPTLVKRRSTEVD